MKAKYILSLSLFIILSLLASCVTTEKKKQMAQSELQTVYFLPSEVLSVDKDIVTIEVEKPRLPQEKDKLALRLAQGIIEKSYLLEGQEVNLNQSKFLVTRVVGNRAELKSFEKSPPFKPGDSVRIYLEKKLIAIKDFEVIMGRNKDAAKYVQEDVTTVLVNSGQFNVVERL